MREDKYGPALQRAIESATEPMTAHQLTQVVGCSRQRTYIWLSSGARDVIEVGRNNRGAALFQHVPGTRRRLGVDGPSRPTVLHAPAVGSAAGDDLTVGTVLHIVGMRWSTERGLVLDLETESGDRVAAAVAAD